MQRLALGVALVMALRAGPVALRAETSQLAASPSSKVPVAIMEELQARGCKVPRKRPKNIIQGEFFRSGQYDWAALCPGKKSTSLVIFPAGSREHVVVLETNSKPYSKWSISVINQAQLKSTWASNEPEPIDIDHQGIVSFIEFGEAGVCLYCYSAQGTIHYHHQDTWLSPVSTIIN